MDVRFRLIAGIVGLLVVPVVGCNSTDESNVVAYTPSEQLPTRLGKAPRLQKLVTDTLVDLYGPSPRELRAPRGIPLPAGGAYLANRVVFASEGPNAKPHQTRYHDAGTGQDRPIAGGYAIFRRNCMHCHGASGDGNGPTAAFLWPRPRDYRLGIFKFTSSNVPDKPRRADLRRTITTGIPDTAMPTFEATLSAQEIEQVIDFVIFLGLRGETERRLIDRACLLDPESADPAFDSGAKQAILASLFDIWRRAETDVLEPPVPRVPSSNESVRRGRDLFLGRTETKLECAGCHGPKADGDGPNWIDRKTYNKYVYGELLDPAHLDELRHIADSTHKRWSDSWGLPIRPANLTRGIFKGGREPIDLYRRIAHGINGTPMAAHAAVLRPEQIWDLVNFVLALPADKTLLAGTDAEH